MSTQRRAAADRSDADPEERSKNMSSSNKWKPPLRVHRKTSVKQRAAVLLHIFLPYFAGLFIYPILIYLAWSRWPLLWFFMIE